MKNFFAITFLIIFGSLIFGLILKGFAGNPDASELQAYNEYSLRDRGRFLLTQNLVNNHTFALTSEQAKLADPDVGYSKGHWYELYPPGLSIITIPFYLLGLKYNLSLVLSFAMDGLFSVLILILIFLIAKNIFKLSIWASLFASLVFGFACTSLGYSTSLFQHVAAGFFILSGFYAVYQYKIHRTWGFIWGLYVWLIYSVAIFVDYPNALLMLPVMIYFVLVSIRLKQDEKKFKVSLRLALIFTSVFFLAITFTHGYYNKVNFGSWTTLSTGLPGFREGIQKTLDSGNIQEINDQVAKIQANKTPVKFFSEQSTVTGVRVLLFSIDRGILVYCPIFLLGFLGIYRAFKKSDIEKGVLISLVFVCFFLYFSWGDPYAGWSFGPRYLIPIMPILAIFTSYYISFVRFGWAYRLAAYALFVASSAIALLGAVTTNAVPPRIEAMPLSSKFGIPFNIDFLKSGRTSSFVYNTFLYDHFSLTEYYFIILGLIVFVGAVVLFILPLFEKSVSSESSGPKIEVKEV